MITRYDRFYGALLGLAYGDAIGFPAMFHRFHDRRIPRRRHDFLWRENQRRDEQRILRLTLPFTHRISSETLEPSPTDDTEYALLTLEALLAADGNPTQETLLEAWEERVLPIADDVIGGFSERSAIENMRRGLKPPATGNDNPLHYADAAVCRSVPIGLYCAGHDGRGDPGRAAALAQLDAEITQAEDGVYAARAMAAAISVLAAGGDLSEALSRARAQFPDGSWIAHGDQVARDCLAEAEAPEDLSVLLCKRLINTVYSYGNAAPETLPSALAIVEICEGDLRLSCLVANSIPKAADSLPSMVGALCGAYRGAEAISPQWKAQLVECRGICLPFLKGTRLDECAIRLVERIGGEN